MACLITIEFLKNKKLSSNKIYCDKMRKKAKRQDRRTEHKKVQSGRNSYSFISVSKHESIHRHGRKAMDPVFPGKKQDSNK